MRGEDFLNGGSIRHRAGSPPHARGRPLMYEIAKEYMRITPACAGKTTLTRFDRELHKDHPRMRGEDNECDKFRRHSSGSPPHARGRPACGGWHTVCRRITPACAGKTQARARMVRSSVDHPRMRGEDLARRSRASVSAGSPPHARGRLSPISTAAKAFRITPACAGKTDADRAVDARPADHPRMRGEDTEARRNFVSEMGSPPHARGRRIVEVSETTGLGITPACAGKTYYATFPCYCSTDHPRMRGEDCSHMNPGGVIARITPACAGKTETRDFA